MKKKLMGKRLLGLGMTMACMAATMIVPTYAADNIRVTYNNKAIQFTESMGSPFVSNSRVLVPLRAVSEGMNKKVDWNATTKKVTVSDNKTVIQLTIGNKNVSVNGINKTTDVPATVKSGRTYVPLRFVSECIGANVNWDGSNKLVTITDNNNNNAPSPSTNVTYDNMVPGKQYPISEVISNVKESTVILDIITEDSAKGNAETIKVVKGDTITGINYKTGKPLSIKVDAVGWANDRKMSAALRVSNLEANNLRVYYLQNGKIIGYDLAPVDMKSTYHGKNYYLFGDGLAGTPECLAKATHLAIAAAYTGEMIIIENPTPTPILNIYSK